MVLLDNFDDLMASLELTDERPLLVGIDGRPCSGKSTLADKLIEELKADALFLDDFFIPQSQWPKDIRPAFPFPYFRYQEFIQGVLVLAKGGKFKYRAFDWGKKRLGNAKTIDTKNIIIIEGVSVLCEELLPSFYKKILVVSDRSNEFQAIAERENKEGLLNWKKLYLPSVDIYWQTKPWERADILYAGRGLTGKDQIERVLK